MPVPVLSLFYLNFILKDSNWSLFLPYEARIITFLYDVWYSQAIKEIKESNSRKNPICKGLDFSNSSVTTLDYLSKYNTFSNPWPKVIGCLSVYVFIYLFFS